LLALHALLHFRNVTAAGHHLGVTQPSMSGDLRRLRQMLGDELLVRVGGEYQLTALARDLAGPLTELLVGIDQALSLRPSFDPAADARAFSIGMVDDALPLLFRPLADTLACAAPEVSLHIHAGEPQRMLKLARAEVDLVISTAQDPTAEGLPELRSEPLYVDRWVCAVDANNPRVPDTMTAELFASLRHLEWGLGTPPVPNRGEVAYRTAGLQARVPLTTESFALTPLLLAGTDLVALIPERLGLRFRSSSGLKLLEPPFPTPEIVEAMYWNTVTDADPAHVWLRSTLREIAREL
jgi:DNA-binding transcriptional LysR family regulator